MLIDNGTHSVDIVRYLIGLISLVFAVEGRRNRDLDVEDTVNMFMRTVDGVSANIDLSWSINKEPDHCIREFGVEPLPIGSDDAVASVEVIQAAYDSLARGRWVTADLAFSGGSAALRDVAARPAE